MKVIYLANVFPKSEFEYLFKVAIIKPQQQIQKYHTAYIDEFIGKNNHVYIFNHNYSHYFRDYTTQVQLNNLHFNSIDNSSIFGKSNIYALYKRYLKSIKSLIPNFDDTIIICDMLNVIQSKVAIALAKNYNIKVIGVVTDHPKYVGDYLHKSKAINLKQRLYNVVVNHYINQIDFGVFATEHLAKNYPRIKNKKIIDGIYKFDSSSNEKDNNDNEYYDKNKFTILYAGLLSENYGVKKLVDAFISIESIDVELHIYGTGNLEEYILEIANKDSRIKYKGYVENHILMRRLQQSTLLINPRPPKEVYTFYSFPSKIIEYMSSGTPVITTLFGSLSEEYMNYVIPIDEYNDSNIRYTIENSLKINKEELQNLGLKAKQYILEKKNSKYQMNDIFNWIEENLC